MAKIEIPKLYDGYVVPFQLLERFLNDNNHYSTPDLMIIDGWEATISDETDGEEYQQKSGTYSITFSAGKSYNPLCWTDENTTFSSFSGKLTQGGNVIVQFVYDSELTTTVNEEEKTYMTIYDMKLALISKDTPLPEMSYKIGELTRDPSSGELTYIETARRLLPTSTPDKIYYVESGSIKSFSFTQVQSSLDTHSENITEIQTKLTDEVDAKLKSIEGHIEEITTNLTEKEVKITSLEQYKESSNTAIEELKRKVQELEEWKTQSEQKLQTLEEYRTSSEQKIRELEEWKSTTSEKLTELEGRIEAVEQAETP